MPYQVIPIGRVFDDKSRAALVESLNNYERDGWEFHSVFGVSEKSGCLGQDTKETLYMVMESKK